MSVRKALINIVGHRLFKIIITTALLVFLASWFNFDEFYELLLTAKLSYLGYAIGLIILNRLLMPVKWKLLLLGININVPWGMAIKSYFISSFMGVFLPPTIGGDAVRTYYLSKRNYSLTDVVASIVVERLIGLIVLLLFAVLGCLLFLQYITQFDFDLKLILLIGIVLFVFLIGALMLSLNNSVKNWLMAELCKPRKSLTATSIANKVAQLYKSYVEFNKAKMSLLVFFLLTCIETVLPIVRSYLVGLSFGVDLPIGYYFAFQPIILLLIRLPLTIDGFGINEGLFAYFLGLMGVSFTLGLGIGLVNHILFLLVLLPGGILYLFDKPPGKAHGESMTAK